MHPDLSSHLHTEACNNLINKFMECHNEHKIGKFFGYCNGIDQEMTRCLRNEREERRRQNFEKSQEKRRRADL